MASQPVTVTTTTYTDPALGYAPAPSEPNFGVQRVQGSTVAYGPTPVVTTTYTAAPGPVPSSGPGGCNAYFPIIALLAFQILMGFIYGFRVEYAALNLGTYPLFQDVNVMIFIALGFLMAFLRHHGWSVIGFSLLIAAICVQLFILVGWFWLRVFDGRWRDAFDSRIDVQLDHPLLIVALHSAASAIVSYGALAGKINVSQAIVLALFHNWIYGLNRGIILGALDVRDIGGSIGIFFFGGVFGIFASLIYGIGAKWQRPFAKLISSYESNIFAFIGTLFLFVYFPSFNGALAPDAPSLARATINTTIALTSSVIGAFAITPAINGGRLSIEAILNATIAGGIVIASSAYLISNLFLPIVFGFFAGVISAIGFRLLSPKFSGLGSVDSVGILHTFLIPGFFGGIYSAIMAAVWNTDVPGFVRSNSRQGGIQIACIAITLGIAAIGGAITGAVLKIFGTPYDPFEDALHWETRLKQ